MFDRVLLRLMLIRSYLEQTSCILLCLEPCKNDSAVQNKTNKCRTPSRSSRSCQPQHRRKKWKEAASGLSCTTHSNVFSRFFFFLLFFHKFKYADVSADHRFWAEMSRSTSFEVFPVTMLCSCCEQNNTILLKQVLFLRTNLILNCCVMDIWYHFVFHIHTINRAQSVKSVFFKALNYCALYLYAHQRVCEGV